ncbi:MAG: DUF357 domain-containing protein [Thermoplasmata archaeon]
MTGSEVTKERLEKYLNITDRAMRKLKIAAPEKSYLRKLADDFLEMAKSYRSDAIDFAKKGDYVNAFACINYAHGWLDCGARIGLFDVGGDDQLFTLFE